MNKKQLLEEIKSLIVDLKERQLLVPGTDYDNGYEDCLNYVILELEDVIANA